MKLKLITKVFTYAANLKNCVNLFSIHFHHVHSLLLLDVRHFQNYIVVHFLTLFWRPL